ESRQACDANTDCGEGLRCLCSSCNTQEVCASDSDCPPGHFCNPNASPRADAGACLVGFCLAFPPAVTCGGTVCTARTMHLDDHTVVGVAPCCAPDGGCGLDVSPLYITNDRCQSFGQAPGTPDSTCPGCSAGGPCQTGGLRACRRPDGKCGFSLDELGLG